MPLHLHIIMSHDTLKRHSTTPCQGSAGRVWCLLHHCLIHRLCMCQDSWMFWTWLTCLQTMLHNDVFLAPGCLRLLHDGVQMQPESSKAVA